MLLLCAFNQSEKIIVTHELLTRARANSFFRLMIGFCLFVCYMFGRCDAIYYVLMESNIFFYLLAVEYTIILDYLLFEALTKYIIL